MLFCNLSLYMDKLSDPFLCMDKLIDYLLYIWINSVLQSLHIWIAYVILSPMWLNSNPSLRLDKLNNPLYMNKLFFYYYFKVQHAVFSLSWYQGGCLICTIFILRHCPQYADSCIESSWRVVPFPCGILRFLSTEPKCLKQPSSYIRQDPLLQSSSTTLHAGFKYNFPICGLQELNLSVQEWYQSNCWTGTSLLNFSYQMGTG